MVYYNSSDVPDTLMKNPKNLGQSTVRIFAIDLIRVIAIFMVVIDHVSSRFFNFAPIESFTWFTAVLYYCFHNGTSLFFMVSGMVFLKPGKNESVKTFLMRRFVKVLIPSLFWIVIFSFYKGWFRGDSITLREMALNALNGHVYYHLWYIYALIPLYFIIPIIRKLMLLENKKLIEYILVLWFLGFSIAPAIHAIFPLIDMNWTVTIFGNYLGFMIAGSYFYWFTSGFSNRKVVIIYFLMFILTFASIYIVRLVTGKPDPFFASRASPFMVIMSICIFIFFTHVDFSQAFSRINWLPKIIRYIADSSFAIYILHVVVIELVPKYSILWLGFLIDGKLFGHPIIGIPVFSLLTILILTLVSQLFRKIPIINTIFKVGND